MLLKRLVIEHKPFRLQGGPKILYKFKYIDFWPFCKYSCVELGLVLEIEVRCQSAGILYVKEVAMSGTYRTSHIEVFVWSFYAYLSSSRDKAAIAFDSERSNVLC